MIPLFPIGFVVLVAEAIIVIHELLKSVEGAPEPDHNAFSTENATAETFKTFLKELRVRLTTGGTTAHNIPVLRDVHSVPMAQRYIPVSLTDSHGNTITLAINVTNVYVEAYGAGDRFYILADNLATENNPVFSGNPITWLGFAGRYGVLEGRARQSRENIDLGLTELDTAITTLWNTESFEPGTRDKKVAEALIVIIQMVSEAARFVFIEDRIVENICTRTPSPPGHATLSLENNWGKLSEAIQCANSDGSFNTTVHLRTIRNNDHPVQNLSDPIIRNVALMLYVQCDNTNPHEHDGY